MYCPECGSEVQKGLKYCNRCGANLIAETAAPRLFGIILTLAIAALLIGIIGLTALFFFAIELMGRGNVPAEIVAFLMLFTLVFFGIEALIIWQLSRLSAVYLKSGGASATKETRGVSKPQTQVGLPEARQDFIQTASLHTTASDEAENATRILPEEGPTTRKLVKDE